MHTHAKLSIVLLIALAAMAQLFPHAPANAGDWSREAVAMHDDRGARRFQILSPDKEKNVVLDGSALSVLLRGRRLPGLDQAYAESLPELLWAPDSKAFFITDTDGGWVGDWRVTVYRLVAGRVETIDVTGKAAQAFKRLYECDEPENPEMAGVAWLRDSRSLLLVAEVPDHSTCPGMGMRMGYVVDVPSGAILREMSQSRLKAEFGEKLGDRLAECMPRCAMGGSRHGRTRASPPLRRHQAWERTSASERAHMPDAQKEDRQDAPVRSFPLVAITALPATIPPYPVFPTASCPSSSSGVPAGGSCR